MSWMYFTVLIVCVAHGPISLLRINLSYLMSLKYKVVFITKLTSNLRLLSTTARANFRPIYKHKISKVSSVESLSDFISRQEVV